MYKFREILNMIVVNFNLNDIVYVGGQFQIFVFMIGKLDYEA